MISFIVPAHNEEQHIAESLRALHRAGKSMGEVYEIIVVDDDSTDRTAELALGGGARLVRVARRQISAARNAGARKAEGELLFFVDADTFVPVETASAAVRAMRRGLAGGGARVEFDGVVPFYARVLLFVISRGMKAARLAAGCFIFCTREAFEASGGFDEEVFASEEIAFSRAVGRTGKFRILPCTVITSGRKVRDNPPGKMLVTLVRLILGGRKMLKRRENLPFWYGERKGSRNSGSGRP